MNEKIEAIKCRAMVDGNMTYWITSSKENNALRAQQIFKGEVFAEFSIVDSIVAVSSDPHAGGVFTHVSADMDMHACIAYTVEMNGDDLRV